MHLGDIAFDIQSQISQFCSPNDLANLSTVNTSLRDAAEHVLYSHIYVRFWKSRPFVGKGVRKLCIEKWSLLRTLASNSRKAEMVKALDIDLAAGYHYPDRGVSLIVSKLAEVLEAVPNLVDLRIKCGLTSHSTVRTISQVIRGGHFQLHTLYLEDFYDFEGIIADQAHLRLLGIHQTSHIKTPWAKVKGLYHSSPRRYASPMILVLDDWFSASRWMTMFPAFSDPEVQEYHKIATSPRGLNKFYEEGYALCFCLLGVSEKNGNLLGDMMKAMAQIHSSSYPKWYLYSTLKIIVHDTSIHKPWRFSYFAQSVPLFHYVWALDFYYPDFEERVVRPLATDLHACLLKDLGRAWPKVREIRLRNGRRSVRLELDRQDNWILGTEIELLSDSDDESSW